VQSVSSSRLFGARRSALVAAFSGAVLCAAVQPSHALTINATYIGLTAGAQTVIANAIGFYETEFTDPITVTIQFHDMSSGLGASLATEYLASYSSFRTRLASDATTATDTTALASLPTGSTNPVQSGASMVFKSANGRALGYNTPGGAISYAGFCTYTGDGCIGLNTGITTTGNGSTTGAYNLESVVEHEIDEILGLGSDLSGTSLPSYVAPEDLFRYASSGVRSFATNLSTSSTCGSGTPNAYFSIDGGTTNIANFNNCANNADYGDWATGGPVLVQNAYGTPSTLPLLNASSPEVVALDAIGYDAVVPEPASIVLLITGMAGIAATRRRRVLSINT